MFGATILVPLIVNDIAGETVLTIPVTLLASGLGTSVLETTVLPITGMSLAALVGIILNLNLPNKKKKEA